LTACLLLERVKEKWDAVSVAASKGRVSQFKDVFPGHRFTLVCVKDSKIAFLIKKDQWQWVMNLLFHSCSFGLFS